MAMWTLDLNNCGKCTRQTRTVLLLINKFSRTHIQYTQYNRRAIITYNKIQDDIPVLETLYSKTTFSCLKKKLSTFRYLSFVIADMAVPLI